MSCKIQWDHGMKPYQAKMSQLINNILENECFKQNLCLGASKKRHLDTPNDPL